MAEWKMLPDVNLENVCKDKKQSSNFESKVEGIERKVAQTDIPNRAVGL